MLLSTILCRICLQNMQCLKKHTIQRALYLLGTQSIKSQQISSNLQSYLDMLLLKEGSGCGLLHTGIEIVVGCGVGYIHSKPRVGGQGWKAAVFMLKAGRSECQKSRKTLRERYGCDKDSVRTLRLVFSLKSSIIVGFLKV